MAGAIDLEGITAEEAQRLALQSATKLTGGLLLDRAEIAGALLLSGLEVKRRDGADRIVSLQQARIGARIEVRRLSKETSGTIDLSGAHTGLLEDAGGAGWGAMPAMDAIGRHTTGVLLKLDGFIRSGA